MQTSNCVCFCSHYIYIHQFLEIAIEGKKCDCGRSVECGGHRIADPVTPPVRSSDRGMPYQANHAQEHINASEYHREPSSIIIQLLSFILFFSYTIDRTGTVSWAFFMQSQRGIWPYRVWTLVMGHPQVFGDYAIGVTEIKERFSRFKRGHTPLESGQHFGRPQTTRNAAVVEKVEDLTMKCSPLIVRETAEEV
ncbi:hypothetical protein TNCV_2136531 [Trichonephila clavipes]|nr:hypothetical protein TNCV_2136531 [Trichonephila clavipes]